jgi:putative addiction module killer protein
MSGSQPFRVLHYLTPDGTDVFEDWLQGLDKRDADRIKAYVTRMYSGNFGVTRAVGEGVLELKINFGPGYRLYYLHDGNRIVVLLCGGDKGSQAQDIARAQLCAADYWRRK